MASIDNLYAFIFNRCEYIYSSLPVYIGYGIGSDMKGFGFDDDGSSFFPSSSISHLSDDGQILEHSRARTHERTNDVGLRRATVTSHLVPGGPGGGGTYFLKLATYQSSRLVYLRPRSN
jgi:hypothetical protein